MAEICSAMYFLKVRVENSTEKLYIFRSNLHFSDYLIHRLRTIYNIRMER